MATGGIARLTGYVTGGITPALLPGHVDGADWDALTGTVSRTLMDSWESPSLFFRYRVKLGGEFVDDADLFGALTLDAKDIDSHTSAASFGLRGVQWSIWRTSRVWALTPVEVYIDHGPAGGVIEPASPDWVGYVIGCDQGSDHEPIVTVKCGGPSTLFEKYDACEEFAPMSELTRGEMLETLFAAAGATISSPTGAVYNKPLQAIGKKLFGVVLPFIEPEGWKLRELMDGSGGFETWTPAIKLAPVPADWSWTKGDVESISAIPPESVPSRWVVPGISVRITDELGISRELTVQELFADFAPAVATHIRASDGTLSASGFSPFPTAVQRIKRIEIETLKRGNDAIQQTERTYGWYNPRRAIMQTVPGSGGTAGNGFNYVTGYVDADGQDVHYSQEKFQLTGQRITDWTRDANGTLDAQRVRTSKFGLKKRAVRAVGTPANETDHGSSYVYSDDQSYSAHHEEFGLFEEQQIANVYETGGGALVETTQDTYTWHSPRTRIDGGSYHVLYGGTGQEDINSAWELTQRVVTSNILKDRQVLGHDIVTYGWAANTRVGGANDWGGGLESDAAIETFKLAAVDTKEFNVEGEDQTEEVDYPAAGGRIPRRYSGRRPTTLYTGSTWTRLVSEPFELVVDDATVQEWFGFSRETITSEYILDSAEALRVINMRRRRMLAKKLQVVRPESPAAKGDTVHFVAEEDGINGRFIITEKQVSMGGPGNYPRAMLRLEEWAA